MRARLSMLTVVALTLSGCGGGGPSGPPGLAYGLPQPSSVRYVSADTAVMDIDAGGQAMQANIHSAVTLATSFSRTETGLQVTMNVDDLDARVVNPMASAAADEEGIDGPLVFTLDRRGGVTMVSQPTLDATAEQFFQPLSLAHGFFPRLPGRAAAMGESWTDTIRVEGDQGSGSINAVTVMTYTVAGDSVVNGRSLVKIDMEGTSDVSAQGVTTGMDFTQTLSGTMEGWVLWDQGRNLLVETYGESDARGSMEVAAAPFPLGVRIRGQSRVKLLEGM